MVRSCSQASSRHWAHSSIAMLNPQITIPRLNLSKLQKYKKNSKTEVRGKNNHLSVRRTRTQTQRTSVSPGTKKRRG